MSDENGDYERCGEPIGEDSNGSPCKRPAGWGTDRDHGPCRDHPPDENGDDGNNGGEEEFSLGRDTKLTKNRQERIAGMIENGHSITAACRTNGISTSTFYNWIEWGEEGCDPIFSEFLDRIARARGAGESGLVNDILDAAREQGDTRTLLSVLRSRYPESWADADAGGEDDGDTVVVNLSPEASAESEGG